MDIMLVAICILSRKSTLYLSMHASLFYHGSTLYLCSHDLLQPIRYGSMLYLWCPYSLISTFMDLQCIGRWPCFESFFFEHGYAPLGDDIRFFLSINYHKFLSKWTVTELMQNLK